MQLYKHTAIFLIFGQKHDKFLNSAQRIDFECLNEAVPQSTLSQHFRDIETMFSPVNPSFTT